MVRTRKKYSKRKYNRSKRRFKKNPRTNRKYTKRKYTKRKYTKNKTTRRLRGGMDIGSAAVATPLEVSEPPTESVDLTASDDFQDAETHEGSGTGSLTASDDSDTSFVEVGRRGRRRMSVDTSEAVRRAAAQAAAAGAEGTRHEGYYIRTGDDGEVAEAKESGVPLTTDIKFEGKERIQYTNMVERTANLAITNAWIRSRAATRGVVKRDDKRNLTVIPLHQTESGKYEVDPEAESIPLDEKFLDTYHIKIIGNEGIKVEADFQNEQYFLTENGETTILRFDVVSEGISVDRYTKHKRHETENADIYCIAIVSSELGRHVSDIRWSQFREMINKCFEDITKGGYAGYTSIGNCQKEIEEIQAKINKYHEVGDAAWEGNMAAVAAGVAEDPAAAAAAVAKKASATASGLYASVPTMESVSGWTGMTGMTGWGSTPGEAAAGGVEPEPESGGGQDTPSENVLLEEPKTSKDTDGKLPMPNELEGAKRIFIAISIERLIKCGFLAEIFRFLEEGAEENSKNCTTVSTIGFVGGLMEYAEPAVGQITGAIGSWGLTGTQLIQNTLADLAPEQFLKFQEAWIKEILYDKMCEYGPSIGDQIAEALQTFSTLAEKYAPESMQEAAQKAGTAGKTYSNAKWAAGWWTTAAGAMSGWSTAKMAWRAGKIIARNYEAHEPAKTLWDTLCMVLARCKVSKSEINKTNSLARFLDGLVDFDKGAFSKTELLQHAMLTQHPALENILEQMEGAKIEREEQQALEDKAAPEAAAPEAAGAEAAGHVEEVEEIN